jgi:thiol-disulfide isomerase/thioredoxin
LLVPITVASLAIALLVAVVVVRSTHDSTPVSVDQFVSGEGHTAVDGTAEVGKAAPPTTFQYFDGTSATVAQLTGKPLVINFWASSCAPCLKEMPAFQRAHAKLGDGVTILGVDVSEAIAPGKKMIDKTGVTYPQARDPQGQMVRAYGGVTLPHTVVIDASGKIVSIRSTALTDDEIAAAIAPVLGR